MQAELEDAVYSYRELFRQDGIALEYSSDRAEYGEVISGDPERLKQVFAICWTMRPSTAAAASASLCI